MKLKQDEKDKIEGKLSAGMGVSRVPLARSSRCSGQIENRCEKWRCGMV